MMKRIYALILAVCLLMTMTAFSEDIEEVFDGKFAEEVNETEFEDAFEEFEQAVETTEDAFEPEDMSDLTDKSAEETEATIEEVIEEGFVLTDKNGKPVCVHGDEYKTYRDEDIFEHSLYCALCKDLWKFSHEKIKRVDTENATQHQIVCTQCERDFGKENHQWDASGKYCVLCGYCTHEGFGRLYAMDTDTDHIVSCAKCDQPCGLQSHDFDGKGVCKQCRFRKCDHKGGRIPYGGDEHEHQVRCAICGEDMMYESVAHTGDSCAECGWTRCKHERTSSEFDNEYHSVYCDLCNDEISKEKHSDNGSGICSVCGYNFACTHWSRVYLYSDADNISHHLKCSICGEVRWEDHRFYGSGECYDCGYKRCYHLNGNFEYFNYGSRYWHDINCKDCGSTVNSVMHQLNAQGKCTSCGSDTSCTHTGGYTYTEVPEMNKHTAFCANCGLAMAEYNHVRSSMAAKAATCTESGLTDGVKCRDCGAVMIEQKVIAAKEHSAVKVAEVPATSVSAGVSEYSYCEVCGEQLTAPAAIPALGVYPLTKITIGVGEKFTPVIADTEAKVFKTSKKKIATVSANGVIKGKKAGTAKITVTAANGYTQTLTVVVKKAASKVSLNKKTAKMGVGATMKLKAKLSGTSHKRTWTSSKNSVATVDANGVVTAVGKGTATITVKTFNGKKAKCKVTVK